MGVMDGDDELALLMALVAPDAGVAVPAVGRGLVDGLDPAEWERAGRRALVRLERGGAVARVGRGRWGITEKGRIAAALVLHKRPSLREAFVDAWDGGDGTVAGLSQGETEYGRS